MCPTYTRTHMPCWMLCVCTLQANQQLQHQQRQQQQEQQQQDHSRRHRHHLCHQLHDRRLSSRQSRHRHRFQTSRGRCHTCCHEGPVDSP